MASSANTFSSAAQVGRFRSIFRQVHAGHGEPLSDEWLEKGCRAVGADGHPRPVVWSRRNGPWQRVDVLFVGAAPGNAGGKGAGAMGAHATLIPFGGDIAGANLDVLLSSAGLDRDSVFIIAALNQLPRAGGGEPRPDEIAAAVGGYANSLDLLRDTIIATSPRLIVALGNVGMRATMAAVAGNPNGRLASPSTLSKAGIQRGQCIPWPNAFFPPHAEMEKALMINGGVAPTHFLLITHPSAQNMSPYARTDTLFHTRMVEARDALRDAVRDVLGRTPPQQRAAVPLDGAGREDSIYELPEWRDAIGPRHRTLDDLWRARGV